MRSNVEGRVRSLQARLQTWTKRGSGAPPEQSETSDDPARALRRLFRLQSRSQNEPQAQPSKPAPAPPKKPRPRLEGVRLIGAEEHRCPFCLEIVEPGDGRGMVECPICHTRHHADCWAVTGICQVPHYHS